MVEGALDLAVALGDHQALVVAVGALAKADDVLDLRVGGAGYFKVWRGHFPARLLGQGRQRLGRRGGAVGVLLDDLDAPLDLVEAV